MANCEYGTTGGFIIKRYAGEIIQISHHKGALIAKAISLHTGKLISSLETNFTCYVIALDNLVRH